MPTDELEGNSGQKKRTLREWREVREMTPMELAYKAGVSLTTVLDVEQSRRSPSVITAQKIVAVLGISVADVRWPEEHEIIRRPRRPKSQAVAA